MSSVSDDRLDLVVFGATGVTGRRAVAYLRERAPEVGAAWGIAGRDRDRLDAEIDGWGDDERPEVLVVDATDDAAVAELAARTRVVVNFVGPFARYADPVIAACADAGADYLDVSGEIGFVAEVIARHHERARRSGARIVQVAGFEALPFDVGARLVDERLRASVGTHATAIDVVTWFALPPGVPRLSDGASVGTVTSLLHELRGAGARRLGDPAALLGGLGDADEVRRTSPISLSPRTDGRGAVVAPMAPSPLINPPVIQRTRALLGLPPAAYREGLDVSTLVPTRAGQAGVAAVVSAFQGAVRQLAEAPAPVRATAARVGEALLPSDAAGPRADRLEGWTWGLEIRGRTDDGDEALVEVDADGHPGYLATSRLTAEAGLALSDTHGDDRPAGCVTPAVALGTDGLDRFERAGVRFLG